MNIMLGFGPNIIADIILHENKSIHRAKVVKKTNCDFFCSTEHQGKRIKILNLKREIPHPREKRGIRKDNPVLMERRDRVWGGTAAPNPIPPPSLRTQDDVIQNEVKFRIFACTSSQYCRNNFKVSIFQCRSYDIL